MSEQVHNSIFDDCFGSTDSQLSHIGHLKHSSNSLKAATTGRLLRQARNRSSQSLPTHCSEEPYLLPTVPHASPRRKLKETVSSHWRSFGLPSPPRFRRFRRITP